MNGLRQRFLLLALGLGVFFGGCTAASKVTPLTDTKKSKLGALYILPKTRLEIEIPIAIKIINGQIESAALAVGNGRSISVSPETCKQYLENKGYAVTKTIKFGDMTVTAVPVPDKDNIYNIDFKTTFWREAKSNFVFNEQHMITSGSSSANNKALELAVDIVKTAASVAAVVAKEGQPGSVALARSPGPAVASAMKKQDMRAACHRLENAMLRSRRQAASNAARLTERKNRWLFGENAGSVDRSYDIYKARLEDINKAIAAQENQAASERTVNLTYTGKIEADALEEGKDLMLFWIEGEKIVAPNPQAFSGSEKGLAEQGLKSSGTPVSLKIVRSADDPALVVQQHWPTDLPKERAIYYRMPARAEVILEKDGQPVGRRSVQIAQWGPVLSLPARLGAADSGITFEFFTDTGGLKALGADNKAIDMEQAGKLGDAGVALVKAIVASDDEIARLTKENTKLTLQKANRDLRTSLQTP